MRHPEFATAPQLTPGRAARCRHKTLAARVSRSAIETAQIAGHEERGTGMAIDWLALLKIPGWVLKKPVKFAVEKYARHKASERAIRGEDLADQSSLHYLVKTELERLAGNDRVPSELQSFECRRWLREGDNVEFFVEVLIARAGGQSQMSERAEERLAAEFERVTGETRKLAAGRVRLAVSHVYGQICVTELGRQALKLALEQWTAAQVFSLGHPEQRQFPTNADLARVKAMAWKLLEAGKRSWKMPRFVAPLTLEASEQQEGQEPHLTNASELSKAIDSGESLVLFGAGGIGKTTFLLDLCTSCMIGGRRIPLYVDAAVWARSTANLLDYIAASPSAQIYAVTSTELARLAEAGYLGIMVNGWNEIPAGQKFLCREAFNQLTTAAGALSVVVVSRTPSDAASLPAAKRIEVRGLTWQGQSAVIRAELSEDMGAPLLALLAKDTRLRHAARSPLILRGLIAQAKKGAVESSSVFDLLGSAVQAFEEDDQRKLVLSVAPVDGHQGAYLEELACLLTQQLATNCSKDDALQAMQSASALLAERRLVGAVPSPASVLDVLISHHLLHLDDGAVRFAHQRFQEYFAATRLLRECIEDVGSQMLLRTAVNQPAWDESLMLVAGKLRSERGRISARVRMVTAAAAVDLGLACDLAGVCALGDADDSKLHDHLVTRVNQMTASPLEEVRDLGVSYQIASGLPAFAPKLWQLLESENMQTRLHTYRLNSSAISLAQLGAVADRRVASWSSDRRTEFVHEIADNADNYNFLVGLARKEPDLAVRAAAICALFWHFPASDVPLQAWLDAPVEVQIKRSVVNLLQYALEEGHTGDAVRERLQTIALNDASENTQLQLALAFPCEVGPRALDVVFKRLGSSERHGNDAPLVAIARTNAPERLVDVARELAFRAQVAPKWVGECLRETPVEVKTGVFERAWIALQGQEFKNPNSEVLGPLADRYQTERSVAEWLRYAEVGRETLTDIDHERHRQLGYLLAHSPGGDLLHVVMQRGLAASYNEAAQLIELVLRRIGHEGGAVTLNQWLPTLDEMRQLVALFGEKAESAEVPQDTVRVYLCCVASHVAPAEFGSLLLETCRRHLDAWSTFRDRINQWSKNATSPRPRNPGLSLYLVSALARWGPDALPGLLELMAHPGAMEFIPMAIARVVNLPWTSKRERPLSGISDEIQEGWQHRRLGRELRQPDDSLQHWTDEAAKALAQKLSELVAAYEKKKATAETWNPREAEYSVGHLAGIVASIPSPDVVAPVHHALASGLMDVYGVVGALRGLVRQGLYISDAAAVGQFEVLYEREAGKTWHDDSLRYAMSELSELLFCVAPPAILSKPVRHYLMQWRRFSYPNEVIRHLGAMHSEAAWTALMELSRGLAVEWRALEELARALISALRPRHLTEFITLVADRSFLAWCGNEWVLEQLAPRIAAVIEKASAVEAFVEACRRTQSPLADVLAGEVLSHIKRAEEARQSLLVEAIDAGRATPHMATYRMLENMFSLRTAINDTQYEITPKASNALRAQLYARAKSTGPIADGCRGLLASLECERRKTGRPLDEPRHPAPEDGLVWTDALVGAQIAH